MNELHEEIWSSHDAAHPFAEIREGDDLLAVVRWMAELGLAIELCPPKREGGTAVPLADFLRVVERGARRLAPLPAPPGDVRLKSESAFTETLAVLDGGRVVNVGRDGTLYASLSQGRDHATWVLLVRGDGAPRSGCPLDAFRASLERAAVMLTA